jgi:hypothetical protein
LHNTKAQKMAKEKRLTVPAFVGRQVSGKKSSITKFM